MYISEKTAEAITAIGDVPLSASEATRRCILDAVSAAVPGQGTPGGKAARDGAVAAWGNGSIPIWLSSGRSTATGAAFANSAAASVLDIDYGHRAAAGHPGASIVPAVSAAVHEDPPLAPRAVTRLLSAMRSVSALPPHATCGRSILSAPGAGAGRRLRRPSDG
jgi:2-methylcitrate dehydratase PrpD